MGYEVPAGTEHAVTGGMSEADINAQNQFMRSQPWYQQYLASIGQSPDSVRLNDQQKTELLRLAQANGVVVDEGAIEVDPAGNFNPRGHKMRNALLGAGIAGAAALTGGAALGAFGGAGGAGAAGAAGTGGMSGLMGAGAVVPGAALGAGGGIGGATAGMSAASGGGLLAKAGSFLKNGKTSDILGAVGDSIGAATQAAGQNRIGAAELNMRGNGMYENQLMARSKDEQGQRDTALDNVYRNSWYSNRQAGPNNARGITPMNDQFKQTLAGLADQGATKLATTAQYDSNSIPGLKPYEPSTPGLLERVGTWAGPILSGAGTIGGILKPKPKPGISNIPGVIIN